VDKQENYLEISILTYAEQFRKIRKNTCILYTTRRLRSSVTLERRGLHTKS